MKLPKISLIVPVYNVENYITRCYNSIIKQTYTDFECVFVDDCSSDGSIAVLNGLLNDYSGEISFRLIRHEKNSGVSASRNTGINNAAGDYVYFLDSDDEITVNCMDSFMNMLKKYPGVDVIQGNTIIFPEVAKNRYEIKYHKFPEYSENQLWIKRSIFVSPTIPRIVWNKLIRRSFINENKLFFREGVLLHEDVHFVFFLTQKAKCIAFTVEYCYIYHTDNLSSITRSSNKIKSLQSWHVVLNDMLANIDSDVKQESYKFIAKLLPNRMLRKEISGDRNLLLEYRKIVNKCLWHSFQSLRLLSCMALLLFFLPYNMYSSFAIRKLIKLFLI